MKRSERRSSPEIDRRGWTLVGVFEDRAASGGSLHGRPGLGDALGAVERGQADALIVAKLDRLSRSVADFAGLVERSRSKGWALVALDVGVDTTSPAGEMLANVVAVFAQFERRLIGQRTREALAVKRAQGVRLGRPPALPAETRERIRAARSAGATLRAIADELNAARVPTAHNGRAWHPETVRRVLARCDVACSGSSDADVAERTLTTL